MQYPESVARGRREGSGSTEATEMILNNLFYITTKVKLQFTAGFNPFFFLKKTCLELNLNYNFMLIHRILLKM